MEAPTLSSHTLSAPGRAGLSDPATATGSGRTRAQPEPVRPEETLAEGRVKGGNCHRGPERKQLTTQPHLTDERPRGGNMQMHSSLKNPLQIYLTGLK